MKLTSFQIDYISNYVTSFGIKWYELQVEITDHIVLSAEEFFKDVKELTNEQIRDFIASEMNRNGFITIEKERTKILLKEHKKKQLKMAAEYFKFPKIIASIFIVFVVYKGSFYFNDIAIYIRILYGFLFGFSAIAILNWYRFRKINGKQFLQLETAFRMNNAFGMFSLWGVFYAKQLQENLDVYHLKFIIVACFWVFGMLMVSIGIDLTNKIMADIKKQYQLI